MIHGAILSGFCCVTKMPMKSFTTEAFAQAKQLAAWQQIMSEVYYSLEIRRERRDGLRGRIHECDIGPVSVTRFDSDEQRVFRTRERIGMDPEDAYAFVIPTRKELYYSQAGRNGIIKPGGYVLVSTAEFYELSCPDGFLNWTVKMPGELLRHRIPNADDYCACRFPNSLAMARVAHHHIRSVALTFGNTTPPNEAALARNLIDLLALVLQAEPDSLGTERHARFMKRKRIIAYIREHLHDPGLSPRTIAEHNGLSLSYLYKLFEPSEITIGEFIRNQRLQLAYERLAATEKDQSTVAEVAYAAGFRDVSHFSRVFSRRYHMPPGAVRRRPDGAMLVNY